LRSTGREMEMWEMNLARRGFWKDAIKKIWGKKGIPEILDVRALNINAFIHWSEAATPSLDCRAGADANVRPMRSISSGAWFTVWA
jgi:hypothetical protein